MEKSTLEKISLDLCLNMVSKSELLDRVVLLENQLHSRMDEADLLLELGIAYHHLAQQGDKSALSDCQEMLQRVIERHPGHAIALAYLGSSLTLRGNLEQAIHKKLKYTRQGIETIDKAISLAPDNLIVRWVRAMNSLNLPSFFGRTEICLKDFDNIIHHDQFRIWPKHVQANIFLHAGLAWQKNEDPERARQYLQQANNAAPHAEWTNTPQADHQEQH